MHPASPVLFSDLFSTFFCLCFSLSSTETFQILYMESLDVSTLAYYIFLCHADIYLCTFHKQFRSTTGIADDEQTHDDFCSHIVQSACQEIVSFLIVQLFGIVQCILVHGNHLFHASLQWFHAVAYFLVHHLLDDAQCSTVGDVTDGSYHL